MRHPIPLPPGHQEALSTRCGARTKDRGACRDRTVPRVRLSAACRRTELPDLLVRAIGGHVVLAMMHIPGGIPRRSGSARLGGGDPLD